MNLNDPCALKLGYEDCTNDQLEQFLARFACRRRFWSGKVGYGKIVVKLDKVIDEIAKILMERADSPVWNDVIG